MYIVSEVFNNMDRSDCGTGRFVYIKKYSKISKNNTKTIFWAFYIRFRFVEEENIDLMFYIFYNHIVVSAYTKKRKKDDIMQNCKKIVLKFSGMLAPLAMALAVVTVNSTCFFYTYQPEVPAKLKHD